MSDAASSAATTAYVIVAGAAVAWGVPAAAVTRVVPEAEWAGAPPLDPARVLGFGAAHGAARVLVVASPAGPLAVRATGELATRPIPGEHVAALPPLARSARHASAVAGVVFGESLPPILILDVVELARQQAPEEAPR